MRPVTSKPTEPGKEGDLKTTSANAYYGGGGGGSTQLKYWQYTNGDWKEISKTQWERAQGGSTSFKSLAAPTLSSTTGSLRYPKDAGLSKESDYVLFEFYKYKPPFQGINRSRTVATSDPLATYNQSVTDEAFYTKTTRQSVILYMPEDISTGYKANWSGKAFSNIGRDVLTTAGSSNLMEGLANAGQTASDMMTQIIPNLGNKTITEVIGKITGEQVGINDVFATTRGVILNPNVELLFGGIDLRNFSLNFKLVPRNDTEAKTIRSIVDTFRKAMLPNFADGDELVFSSKENTQNNYIKVPNVCRVSFMKGGIRNEFVPQYKMCAITQVDINYTPDGAYATYGDGHMVAIELSLAFQETKLIFSEEVDQY